MDTIALSKFRTLIQREFEYQNINRRNLQTRLDHFITHCAQNTHTYVFIVCFPGLERKISVRTSKEELIQRGILLPAEVRLCFFDHYWLFLVIVDFDCCCLLLIIVDCLLTLWRPSSCNNISENVLWPLLIPRLRKLARHAPQAPSLLYMALKLLKICASNTALRYTYTMRIPPRNIHNSRSSCTELLCWTTQKFTSKL